MGQTRTKTLSTTTNFWCCALYQMWQNPVH